MVLMLIPRRIVGVTEHGAQGKEPDVAGRRSEGSVLADLRSVGVGGVQQQMVLARLRRDGRKPAPPCCLATVDSRGYQ